MRRLLIASIAIAPLAAGCTSAHLYPVSGPAMHGPALSAKLTNVPAGHGKFTVEMPDGENVEGVYSTDAHGTWSFEKGTAATTASPSGSVVTISAADWVEVFGPGYSVAKMQRGEASATGNKSTTLAVEFAVDSMSGKGFGVARDSKGNLYRFELEGLPAGTGASQGAVPDAQPPRRGKS